MKKDRAHKKLSLTLATVRLVSKVDLAAADGGVVVTLSGCMQTCGCPRGHDS